MLLLLMVGASRVSVTTTVYSDALAGSDSSGDGSVGNPYQTITRALQHIAALPTPTGEVHAMAKADTSGTVVYSMALGEQYPLDLRPGVKVRRAPNTNGSQSGVPLVVTGAGTPRATTLFQINAVNGEIYANDSGLQAMTLEETTGPAVSLYCNGLGIPSAPQVDPEFRSVIFNQCGIGLQVVIGDRRSQSSFSVSPSVVDCVFTAQASQSGAFPAQPVTTHVRYVAQDRSGLIPSASLGGTIATSSFTVDATGGYTVGSGLELSANGGTLQTVISDCTIEGNALTGGPAGIARGIHLKQDRSTPQVPTKNNTQILACRVMNCGINGIELAGSSSPSFIWSPLNIGGEVRVSGCTIIGNGFQTGALPPDEEGHGISIHVGDFGECRALVEDCRNSKPLKQTLGPEDARIANNARAGIFVGPVGDPTGSTPTAVPQANTFSKLVARLNQVRDNGSWGIDMQSMYASHYSRIARNQVFNNASGGVRQYGKSVTSYPRDTSHVNSVILNNFIFEMSPGYQAVGLYNGRKVVGVLAWGGVELKCLFNTVAYNSISGLTNYDSFGQGNCGYFGAYGENSCTEVFGTLFRNNGPAPSFNDLDPLEFNTQYVQYNLTTYSLPGLDPNTNISGSVSFKNANKGDLHLQVIPPNLAIDWVPDTLPPQFGTVSVDFDGEARTFDQTTVANYLDRTTDIGADEVH